MVMCVMRVEQWRERMRPGRHRTYMAQLVRRPHAMGDKAEEEAAMALAEKEKKRKEEEEMPEQFKPLKPEELLELAGGDKDMVWKSSEKDFMRRTVLAKKVRFSPIVRTLTGYISAHSFVADGVVC